jgi:hypothetical protein
LPYLIAKDARARAITKIAQAKRASDRRLLSKASFGARECDAAPVDLSKLDSILSDARAALGA